MHVINHFQIRLQRFHADGGAALIHVLGVAQGAGHGPAEAEVFHLGAVFLGLAGVFGDAVREAGVVFSAGVFAPRFGLHQLEHPALEDGMGVGMLHEQPEIVGALLPNLPKTKVAILLDNGFQPELVPSEVAVLLSYEALRGAVGQRAAHHVLHRPLVDGGKAIEGFAEPGKLRCRGLGSGWKGSYTDRSCQLFTVALAHEQ